MKDWPALLSRAKESLDSILSESSKSPPVVSEDPTQRLFNSIVEFKKKNKGHKWLSNFEVAAMNLSVHLKASLSIICLISKNNAV
jgi:hypothetical protein